MNIMANKVIRNIKLSFLTETTTDETSISLFKYLELLFTDLNRYKSSGYDDFTYYGKSSDILYMEVNYKNKDVLLDRNFVYIKIRMKFNINHDELTKLFKWYIDYKFSLTDFSICHRHIFKMTEELELYTND